MKLGQAASLVEHPGHADQSVHGHRMGKGNNPVVGVYRGPAEHMATGRVANVVGISRLKGKARFYEPTPSSAARVKRVTARATKGGYLKMVSKRTMTHAAGSSSGREQAAREKTAKALWKGGQRQYWSKRA
jgi:hypothetical protein